MRLTIAALLLIGSAPALADDSLSARPATGSREAVVCYRDAVTGSLAQVRKTCMTRAGWQHQAGNNQAATQRNDDLGRIDTCVAAGGCDVQVGPTGGGGGPGARPI